MVSAFCTVGFLPYDALHAGVRLLTFGLSLLTALLLPVEEKDGDGFAILNGEGAYAGAERAGFCLLNDLGF